MKNVPKSGYSGASMKLKVCVKMWFALIRVWCGTFPAPQLPGVHPRPFKHRELVAGLSSGAEQSREGVSCFVRVLWVFNEEMVLAGIQLQVSGTCGIPCGNTRKNCLRARKALQHRFKMLTCIGCEVYIFYFILFSFELHHSLIDFLHVNNEIAPTECFSESCILPPFYVSYLSDCSDSSISLGFCRTKQEQMPWKAETTGGLPAARVI